MTQYHEGRLEKWYKEWQLWARKSQNKRMKGIWTDGHRHKNRSGGGWTIVITILKIWGGGEAPKAPGVYTLDTGLCPFTLVILVTPLYNNHWTLWGRFRFVQWNATIHSLYVHERGMITKTRSGSPLINYDTALPCAYGACTRQLPVPGRLSC